MQQKEQLSGEWRELLKSLDKQEKRRIIAALGIQEKTWQRWIHGYTEIPHPRHLRQLLKVLPAKIQAHFLEVIQLDPHFSRYIAELALPSGASAISSAFYSRIVEANAITPNSLRWITLCQLILLQAVRQLDQTSLGLCMTILKCIPTASDGKVRTLSEQFSLGTPPWSKVVEQKEGMLGAASVAGQSVMMESLCVIQDIQGERSPNHRSLSSDEYTKSVAALPIRKSERTAGCLFLQSTQPQFFTLDRLMLAQRYCYLLVIAFEDSAFYTSEQIELL